MIGTQIEKLLVLKGKSNSGKTAVMRAFAELMLKKSGVKLIHPRRRPVALDRESADFTLVVEYHGAKIVFASAGDDKWRFERLLSVFAKYQCHIGVVVVSEPREEGCPKAVYDYYEEVKEKIAIDIVEVSKERKDMASKEEIATMVDDCVGKMKDELDKIIAEFLK